MKECIDTPGHSRMDSTTKMQPRTSADAIARPIPYDRLKTALDRGVAASALALLAPVMGLVALAIYAEDPGPVLFRQQRIGRLGRRFTMLKFRTMRLDAPNISTAEMQALGRSYVTRVGAFLRKTSLDELPQLVNVLRGEMSLVGPRPALYNQDDLIAQREAAGVHAVRPGITGLAQVRGRDDLDIPTKVAYDREYVQRRSLVLDVAIILQTLAAVVTSRGNR
jgi:O-antigen biosynthesis protein WbqP